MKQIAKFISLLFLMFIAVGCNNQDNSLIDVTEEWAVKQVTLVQTSKNIPYDYRIFFAGDSVGIMDNMIPFSLENESQYDTTEPQLEPGEYPEFRVVKNGDKYQIQYGENEYRLTKISDRLFEDEIGTEYETNTYVE